MTEARPICENRLNGCNQHSSPDSKMPSLVVFREYDPWFKVDDTGFNKIGYVTRDAVVVYPRRARIISKPFQVIQRRKHQLIDLNPHPQIETMETFFTQNRPNPALFNAGLIALKDGDDAFWTNPVRLPILTPIPAKVFEEKWQKVIPSLQKADLIMTLDTASSISRMIALLDQGTWSHSAIYAGDGKIVEAVTDGVTERGIEVYHDPRFRIGIYRNPLMKETQADKMIHRMRSQLGKRYSYRKVVRLGIRKLFGTMTDRLPKNTSPNDLVSGVTPRYVLIEII